MQIQLIDDVFVVVNQFDEHIGVFNSEYYARLFMVAVEQDMLLQSQHEDRLEGIAYDLSNL